MDQNNLSFLQRLNQGIGQNGNKLLMFGLGGLSGGNQQQSFGNAMNGLMAGTQMDQQRLKTAKAGQQRNKTLEYFQKSRPDLYEQVEAGMPVAEAWKLANQKPEQVQRRIVKGADGYNYFEDGSRVLPDAQAVPDLTTAQRDFQYGQENPDFVQHQMNMKKAGATKIDFNDTQSNAAGFADRMLRAEENIEQFTPAALNRTDRALSHLPVVGNTMVSPEFQQFDQSRRDFINAILRRESGAAIGEAEFESAERQYFPQIGDSPEVIEQKRQNRMLAIQGVQRAAGPNYQAPQTQQSPQQQSGAVDYTEYFK